MKKMLLIFASALLVAISAWMITRNPSGTIPPASAPAVVSLTDVVLGEATPPPTQSEATPAETLAMSEPSPEPQDKDLRSLTNSSTLAGKLAAARRIAGRQDEPSFQILVGELLKAEASGDPADDDFVRDLSQLISQMRGAQVQPIATELAYSTSPTVSRVAVDVAVASEVSPNFQSLESGTNGNIERQTKIDDWAQALHDATPHVEDPRTRR